MLSRFVKVGSSSFCCRDVLVLAILVWRWLTLIFVHLILLWMSECSAFFIMTCSNLLLEFPSDLQCFGVTLFARHLMLKILAVLDLASCPSNFSNFLLSVGFHVLRIFDKCERIHDQCTISTSYTISCYMNYFITHCTNGRLIMSPFTFISRNKYDCKPRNT